MTSGAEQPGTMRVVFVDANVLYSRVLRDYLLYAADEEVIVVAWTAEVLGEVVEHLIANLPGFTTDSGIRLVNAMTGAFPYAEIVPTCDADRRLAVHALPDEDDRHVLAAAIAAEANVLCTANTKDFPSDVTTSFGIEVATPDQLLCALIAENPTQMLAVHVSAVSQLRGATDETTTLALRRAGAPTAASLMMQLIRHRSISTED